MQRPEHLKHPILHPRIIRRPSISQSSSRRHRLTFCLLPHLPTERQMGKARPSSMITKTRIRRKTKKRLSTVQTSACSTNLPWSSQHPFQRHSNSKVCTLLQKSHSPFNSCYISYIRNTSCRHDPSSFQAFRCISHLPRYCAIR